MLPHLHGPLAADAGDGGQALGVLLQHGQGFTAKLLHQALGGGRPDAPHYARSQIVKDCPLPCREAALYVLRFELLTVGGVAHPPAGHRQPLARGNVGHTADDGDAPLVPGVQLEYGIAVLLVLVDDGGHGALYVL